MRAKCVVPTVVVAALLAGAGVADAVPAAAIAPEADVAYHGHVSLWEGRLAVWLVPENAGPSSVQDVTVRLRSSVALADEQRLQAGCVRAGERTVVCETGALPAGGSGRHIGVALNLRGNPAEATVQIDTLWNGGATDRDPANNEYLVLALATGDTYSF